MLFNVSQLLREPTGSTRTHAVDDEVELPFGGPARVRGRAEFIRTPRGLVVRAHLGLTATAECSRCLGEAAIPMELTIEEEYFPTVDPLTGAQVKAPEDAAGFFIDAHHHVDLTPAVQQAVSLAEPMQPLCRPDCRGLCPDCGADRNAGPCGCAAGPGDERWAALRGLNLP